MSRDVMRGMVMVGSGDGSVIAAMIICETRNTSLRIAAVQRERLRKRIVT